MQGRLQACKNLVAEEAVYHRTCLQLFHNKKTLGCNGDKKMMESSQGVWKDDTKMKAFNKFCEWLEVAEDSLYTFSELHTFMQDIAGRDSPVYCLF